MKEKAVNPETDEQYTKPYSIVHFANFVPRRSGMHESTKDQIKYERRAGIESNFVDAYHEVPKEDAVDDGWLRPVPWEKAKEADIWVLHSFIPDKLKPFGEKKINVAYLHGPNAHMILKEWSTNRQSQAFNLHINIAWRVDACVCPDHEYQIMKLYDEHNRVRYIGNSIDLERIDPNGYAWEYWNRPAIGSFDTNRIEKLPAALIWALPDIVERVPTARLNLFALHFESIGTWRNIFCRSKERKLENLCETIQLENTNLTPFMRGIDIGFNNNISGVTSRSTMEMMALGKPVISYGDNDYTPYHAKNWSLRSIAEQVERVWKDLNKPGSTLKADTMQYAKDFFDREKKVKEYVALYEELLGNKK